MMLEIKISKKEIHVGLAIATSIGAEHSPPRANFARQPCRPSASKIRARRAMQTAWPSRSSERVRASDSETALRPLLEVRLEPADGPKRWMPPRTVSILTCVGIPSQEAALAAVLNVRFEPLFGTAGKFRNLDRSTICSR